MQYTLILQAMKIFRFYRSLVDKHPFRVQVIASGTIASIADITAQAITKEKQEKYNCKRTLIMLTFGFCYFGPLSTLWYRFAHRKRLTPLKSLVVDQCFVAPSIVGGFCFLHPLVTTRSAARAILHFKNKYPSVITVAWSIWIPAQTINYTFVPYQFRVLYGLVISLIWTTCLSLMSNSTGCSSQCTKS